MLRRGFFDPTEAEKLGHRRQPRLPRRYSDSTKFITRGVTRNGEVLRPEVRVTVTADHKRQADEMLGLLRPSRPAVRRILQSIFTTSKPVLAIPDHRPVTYRQATDYGD